MTKSLHYKVSRKFLWRYLRRSVMSFAIIIFVLYFFLPENSIVSFLIFLAIVTSVPTLFYLFLHFNHYNNSVDELVLNDEGFVFYNNDSIVKVELSHVEQIEVYITPNMKNNKVPFLAWDEYYFLIMKTTNGGQFYISSLLSREILNVFKNYPILYNIRIYPVIWS